MYPLEWTQIQLYKNKNNYNNNNGFYFIFILEKNEILFFVVRRVVLTNTHSSRAEPRETQYIWILNKWSYNRGKNDLVLFVIRCNRWMSFVPLEHIMNQIQNMQNICQHSPPQNLLFTKQSRLSKIIKRDVITLASIKFNKAILKNR